MSTHNVRHFWPPALVLIIVLPPLVFQAPYFSGTDMSSWAGDWGRINECLRSNEDFCNKLSFFPLAYLLNSWLIGNIHLKSAYAISAINIIFLSLPLLFFFISLNGRRFLSLSLIYITSILCTSLPIFYTYSGALEIQSGVAIGVFVSSWILLNSESQEKIHWRIIVFLIPSGILVTYYKDTNLLIVVGAIMLGHTQKLAVPIKLCKNSFLAKPNFFHLIIACMALSLGAISAIGYNYLRYKTFIPTAYLSIAQLTSPPIGKSFEFLLATFFSPNGGVFIFWSASVVYCLFLLRKFGLRIHPAAITTSLALILSSAFGFSLWWAPFGWDSWGDRLMIPSALASLIIIISTAFTDTPLQQSPNSEALEKQRIHPVLVTLLIVLTIPSIHYTFSAYYSDRSKLLHESLFGGKYCKEMMSAVRNDSKNLGLGLWRTNYYYNCARERFIHIPKLVRTSK